MNNLALSESTPVGEIVYRLEGTDPEDSPVHYGIIGTDRFEVDRDTGDVVVAKPLDREVSTFVIFYFTPIPEAQNIIFLASSLLLFSYNFPFATLFSLNIIPF